MKDFVSSCGRARLLIGDCRETLKTLPDASVNCCVTSPPYYGLRDYGVDGQIGLEQTPEAYVAEMVAVFREVRRVLSDDGTLWLNLGDSYAGSWGNMGGQNRGNGTQREINSGSVVKDQAERNGTFTPPGARGFKDSGIKPKDLIRGESPSDSKPTAGISAKTSYGRSRTRCRKASLTAARRRMNTSSCCRKARNTFMTVTPLKNRAHTQTERTRHNLSNRHTGKGLLAMLQHHTKAVDSILAKQQNTSLTVRRMALVSMATSRGVPMADPPAMRRGRRCATSGAYGRWRQLRFQAHTLPPSRLS